MEELSDCPKAVLTVHPKATAKIIKKDLINVCPCHRVRGAPHAFHSAYTMRHPVHETFAFQHHGRCSIREQWHTAHP